MASIYAYTPSVCPSVFTVLLLIALSAYSWRRRSVPGALPFTVGCLFTALWAASCLSLSRFPSERSLLEPGRQRPFDVLDPVVGGVTV